MFRSAVKPAALFVVCFGAMLVALLLLTKSDRSPPRRGIRIETVKVDVGGHALNPALGGEDLPTPISIENPEFSHFAKLQTASGDSPLTYLSAHLECERVDASRLLADKVRVRIYPDPKTVEDWDALRRESPRPRITLRADHARVSKEWFKQPVAPPPEEEKAEVEPWRIDLEKNVKIVAEGEPPLEVEADRLIYHRRGNRLEAPEGIHLTSAEYEIRGTGLSWQIVPGASEDSVAVSRDVQAVLPTAVLMDAGGVPSELRTRISSRGPLTIHRKRVEHRVLSRVTFEDDVTVLQEAAEGEEPKRLRADRLVIELEVPADLLTRKAELPPDAVKSLLADGKVVLRQGEDSVLRASRILVVPGADGQEVTLGGPLDLRHKGDLAAMFGGEGAQISVLTLRSKGGATIVRKESAKSVEASFRDGVTVRRTTEEGVNLLTLESDSLQIESMPSSGEKMTAEGRARFESTGSEGRGRSIVWLKEPDGREEIRLSGDPEVKIAGGGGFNPFGAPVSPPESPPANAPADDSLIVARSRGDMTLVTREETRDLEISGRVTVTKTAAGEAVFHVEADHVSASLVGDAVRNVEADGKVLASGRSEGPDAGTYSASGETFAYQADEGVAKLSGAPAIARFAESPDRVNQIEAPLLRFENLAGRFMAEKQVKAVVYLEEDERRTKPFVLECDDLTVTPNSAATGDASPAGRISSLLATGNLSLRGRNAVAHGERLSYRGGPNQEIGLTGNPARLTQLLTLAGSEYEDRYEGTRFEIRLKDRDISRIRAEGGGRFLLHRLFDSNSPAVLGPPASSDGAKVERLSGACTGDLTYDTVHALMNGDAWVEQALGEGTTFRRVGRFEADRIEATRGFVNGEPQLVSASGHGRVRGTGDGWKLYCDTFELDLLKHVTRVRGNPARIVVEGVEQRARQATYDYVGDQWEFVGLDLGGR